MSVVELVMMLLEPLLDLLDLMLVLFKAQTGYLHFLNVCFR